MRDHSTRSTGSRGVRCLPRAQQGRDRVRWTVSVVHSSAVPPGTPQSKSPSRRAWSCPGHAPVGHCRLSPPHVPSTTVPRPVASGKDIAQEHKRVLDSHPMADGRRPRVAACGDCQARCERPCFPLVLRERQKARDRDGGEPGLAGARLPRCTRGSVWHMIPISMVKSRARQA
jgi:hypothetical protein